jgi:predicted ester cyclase
MTDDGHHVMPGVIDGYESPPSAFSQMLGLERRTALIAIGSLLIGACATGGKLMASDSKAQRNKANYLAAKAAYNARDLDACVAYYAPDHQIMSKPTQPGRENIRKFFEGSFVTWPDIQVTVETALAEGDWVLGRSVSTTTHSVTAMGVAPTGRKIETGFWDLHRFNDEGLIAQTWNLTDSLAVMQQLGVVPRRS